MSRSFERSHGPLSLSLSQLPHASHAPEFEHWRSRVPFPSGPQASRWVSPGRHSPLSGGTVAVSCWVVSRVVSRAVSGAIISVSLETPESTMTSGEGSDFDPGPQAKSENAHTQTRHCPRRIMGSLVLAHQVGRGPSVPNTDGPNNVAARPATAFAVAIPGGNFRSR